MQTIMIHNIKSVSLSSIQQNQIGELTSIYYSRDITFIDKNNEKTTITLFAEHEECLGVTTNLEKELIN